ncbi:MAG: OmpA family protein [Nitrospirota bacterium]|nr:OmpA family protein [Nitrospirota bacterium]MDE3217955.1 OmpA family protein [Nitrospirota bacterium]
MNRNVQMVCLLAFSCMALWSAGCSSKAVRSGGTPAYPAPSDSMPSLSMTDLSGTERPGSGIAMAKMDPATARRQRDEMRAEQNATEAAGLRDVFFGYDTWSISEEGRQALTRDAEWLRLHPAVQLKVEGHCDERGSTTYNFVLAEKRAKSVRNYLMELGIRPERFTVVSYGKERPFCKDRSDACYQQNRRGHLVVRP